jgi:hypothetical protein
MLRTWFSMSRRILTRRARATRTARIVWLSSLYHGNFAMPTDPDEFGEAPRVVLVALVDTN